MPTAILAEDEPLLLAELREALASLWPELQVVAEASDGASTVRAIREHAPDVAFLDINMPQLSGLEVARVVQPSTAIVFLTAYNQHALEAFDLGAVDYLTKPLNRGRLMQTISRLQARGAAAPAPQPVPVEKAEPKYLRWIQASVGNLLRLITTDEIYYFQSDAKYTRVVTAQAEALIRKPIKDLMEELNPDEFIQVSRGAIVNLRRVESIYRSDGHMEVRLKGRDERLTVSVGYQPAFRQL
ncbi:MAG TPA: LytTR family DNA-binding domain-containing protein [Telluria sp.]